MQDLSNHIIKGYQLRDRLGAGGFGAVYKAYQTVVERDVAIKIILPGLANQPDFIRRFETEAQVIARLEHPCIVPLYDYWRDPDGAYLVMRWLRGGSLADLLTRGPLDVETISRLLDQVASALALAHRSNIIHRDIKPGNILLDEDNNAYLADFGIAKDLQQPNGSGTQMDAIIGSLDYISPEQARSEPVTPRTDIYSLGVVLYEMLTGKHPFPNMTSVERLYKHINDPLPDLTNLDEAIQFDVNEVVQKATEKNPSQRYESVSEFAAAFKEAVGLNRVSSGSTIVELFTQREQEVLSLLVAGLSNKEMAQKLVVTVATVKWYVNELFRKLRVRSRVQAIVRARELNLTLPLGETNGSTAPSVMMENLAEPENPYKGLRAFQAADERDFFGREDLVQKLLKRMTPSQALTKTDDEHRFLAVVGPSGSGKSSVVRAGLIPALLRGGIPGSERWFVVEMMPGAHPYDELEIALLKIAPGHIQLRDQLTRDERGLLRAVQLLLPNDNSELVIVMDQFEEVFTLVEDETVRMNFLNLMLTTVTEKRSRVRIIMTLRADFYDRPLNYPDFGDLLRHHMETILPLSAKGIERAIVEPAKRAGITFEDGLIATIVADVNYQAGALPLLQYALTELFEQRSGRVITQAAYHAIGGAVGALAKRAEVIYQELSDEAKNVTRQMFLRLVTLGEGVEDTRRRTARAELAAINPDTDVLDEVIDTYAGYRLLALDNDPSSRMPTVEVAHEALLREWERLRGWLNESRDDIRLQRGLANSAEDWETSKRDDSYLLTGSRLTLFEGWKATTTLSLTPNETTYLAASLMRRERDAKAETERQAREKGLEKRSQTFLRGLVGVFAAAAVIAFILSGAAINSANTAHEAQQQSEASLQRADALRLVGNSTSLLPGNNINAELAAELAIHSLNIEYSSEAEAALTQASRLLYTTALYHRPDGARFRSFPVFFKDELIIPLIQDNAVYLHHIKTSESTLVYPAGDVPVTSSTLSLDGTMILVGFDDGSLRIWETTTLKEVFSITDDAARLKSSIAVIGISTDDRQVVAASSDGVLRLWNIDSAVPVWTTTLTGRTGSFLHGGLMFSPDGRFLSVLNDNMVDILDAKTGKLLHEIDVVFGMSNVFSSDSKLLMVASSSGVVALFDPETGTEVRRISGTNSAVNFASFSPDDRYVSTASGDGTARIYDTNTGQELRIFSAHRGRVGFAGFSPDGSQILTGGPDDHTWRLWNARLDTSFNQLAGIYEYESVFFTRDGQGLIAAPLGMDTLRYDIQTLKPTQTLSSDGYAVVRALSPDGKYVFASIEIFDPRQEHVKEALIELESGKTIQSFIGHSGILRDASFSPDGHLVATGSADGTSRLWDVATGKELHQFDKDADQISAVTFRTDGQAVFTGGFADGIVREWDVKTGELLRQFETPNRYVSSALSDGERLYIGGSDDMSAWDIATGQQLWHSTGYVGAMALSSDHTQLVTGGADGAIRFWNMQTGQQIRQIYGLTSEIFWLDFSPDGSRLISSSANNKIFFWDTDYHQLVDEVCQHIYQDMTDEERARYYIPDSSPTCSPSN